MLLDSPENQTGCRGTSRSGRINGEEEDQGKKMRFSRESGRAKAHTSNEPGRAGP